MSAALGPASWLVKGRSRRSGGRRRLYSLAKARHRDDDSSGSSSGTDSDSETSDHRSKTRSAPASVRSRGINWEVWVGMTVGMLGIGILAYYLLFGSEADAGSSTASTASATAVPATMALPATTSAAETTNPVTSGLTLDTTATNRDTAPTNRDVSKTASENPTQTGGAGSSSTPQTSLNSPSQQPKSTTQAAQTSSKGYGQTYTGKSTFYSQNGNPGACGNVNPDEALICALQTKMYAKGKHCGRKIQITRTSGKGGQIVVTVADECPSCEGDSYIDLSTGAYDKLGTRDEGMFDISWSFVD